MEILIEFGTKEQQEKYLYPLLRGEIQLFCHDRAKQCGSNPVKMSSGLKRRRRIRHQWA